MNNRRRYLGASDAAAACGLSKWATPMDLYLSKIGEAPPVEETLPMRIGKALEGLVINEFTAETGLRVVDQQKFCVDPTLPWRSCTIDGVTEDGKALVEAKTAGSAMDWGEGADNVPLQYLIQASHQMAVTGLTLVYIPVLLAGRQFRVYEVKRDDDLIAALTDKEKHFWQCVETRTPPDIQTIADAAHRWPRDTGKVIQATPDVYEAWQKLKAVRERLKQDEADADALEVAIKACMADAATLAGPGGETLATWKSQSARRFQSTEFKATHPDLYEAFRVVSESRVFRIK